MNVQKLDARLKFARTVMGVCDLMNEESFDTFENTLDLVKLGFEEEFRRFLIKMLKEEGKNFIWAFATPTSELFGSSWQDLQDRYQLMDDMQKEELYIKLGTYFVSFFMKMFPSAGEKVVSEIADMFKMMMIDRLRDKQIQARKV